MPFKSHFNSTIGSPIKVDEVVLFNALFNAISTYPSSSSIINKIEIIHGTSHYMLEHSDCKNKCELSDIMILTKKNKKYRLSFLQNKVEKNKIIHKNSFKAQANQYYMYNDGRKKPVNLCIGKKGRYLPDTILMGDYSSVINYGVFFKDKIQYEMKMFSTDVLKPQNPLTPLITKSTRKFNYIPFPPIIDEINFCNNVNSFYEKLINFKIGKLFYESDIYKYFGLYTHKFDNSEGDMPQNTILYNYLETLNIPVLYIELNE